MDIGAMVLIATFLVWVACRGGGSAERRMFYRDYYPVSKARQQRALELQDELIERAVDDAIRKTR